jgi:transcription elongation factor Elf1
VLNSVRNGNKLKSQKCKKSIVYSHALREHKSRRLNESEIVFTCEDCNLNYISKRALNAHTKATHNGGIYVCGLCYNSSFKRFSPVRIRVRIDPPYPHACRKRQLNGVVLRIRREKSRPRVTVGVAR